ncbi:hypothetical protein Y032_1019g3405 [Ancylostoma ceylanicum]|uniref:Uncharacterized protein n=1 Tax=Ancylostoma ceylanicum TaxID=53326 RepID=A0A016W7L1_9BILA|nr:hypothetical protein Y032_1019g3405 [Ancylostoma ceylanicum]
MPFLLRCEMLPVWFFTVTEVSFVIGTGVRFVEHLCPKLSELLSLQEWKDIQHISVGVLVMRYSEAAS